MINANKLATFINTVTAMKKVTRLLLGIIWYVPSAAEPVMLYPHNTVSVTVVFELEDSIGT